MTVSPVIVPVNTAIETWLSLINKINSLIDFADNNAVSVDLTSLGAVSTGNGFVNGLFGANTLVCSIIRGGSINTLGNLAIVATSLSIGNDSVNTVANSSQITVSNVLVGNATNGFMANTSGIRVNNTFYTSLATDLVVANNNVNIGTRPRINFFGAGTTTLGVVDNVANDTIDITITSTGGSGTGEPEGANTNVQFNDSGDFLGTAGFTFNKTTNSAAIANALAVAIINHSYGRDATIAANSSVLTEIVLDSFFLADYRSAEYFLSIRDNTTNSYQTTKLAIIHNDGVATMTEFGTVFTNTDIAIFTATTNATHVKLGFTGATLNTAVKGFRRLIAV